MLWCSGVYFHCFSGCYDKKIGSVELFCKVRNGWAQSSLTLGYSMAKLLKKLACNFTAMKVEIISILFHEVLHAKPHHYRLLQSVLKHSLNSTQVNFKLINQVGYCASGDGCNKWALYSFTKFSAPP